MGSIKDRTAFNKRTRSRIAAKVFIDPGSSPGSIRPLPDSPDPKVTLLQFKPDARCKVSEVSDFKQLPCPEPQGLNWVRVTGLGKIEPLIEITEFYGISRMALEDTLATGWRTKVEQEEKFIYFILQGPPYCEDRANADRLALYFCPGLLITFEDKPTYVINHLWERLQSEAAALHNKHLAEFFTYMILDILVDGFFPHLDITDEKLARLEEVLLAHVPSRDELRMLYEVKRDLTTLRRLITPFKEIRSDLVKSHPPETLDDLRPFITDLSDHVMEVVEMLDTYHEVTTSLDETCQSIIGNRVNEIIRILTIISTIFLPLTLISGIFGMNFEHMPGVKWAFGFVTVIVFMLSMVFLMLLLFRRSRWL